MSLDEGGRVVGADDATGTPRAVHVADPAASARFYAVTLDLPPVEASPDFAMFILGSGTRLGLWASHDVQPPATAPGRCTTPSGAACGNGKASWWAPTRSRRCSARRARRWIAGSRTA